MSHLDDSIRASAPATGGATPACDVGSFIERVGGDVELAREMALLFVPDALRLLDTIDAAIAAGDAERLRQEAHALKGSAGNFDAAPTVNGAFALEVMGRSGQIAGASVVFAKLRSDVEQLAAELQAFAEAPT